MYQNFCWWCFLFQIVNGYFVHFFAPTNLPKLSKNIIFVLDTSGSMSGREIEQVSYYFTLQFQWKSWNKVLGGRWCWKGHDALECPGAAQAVTKWLDGVTSLMSSARCLQCCCRTKIYTFSLYLLIYVMSSKL